MKLKNLVHSVTLILVGLLTMTGTAQNLLNNGDFQAAGISGFNINTGIFTQITQPFSGTTVSGNFAITTNPQPMNTAFFISGGDHTTGTGNMLVIDGTTVAGQQNFWEAGNGGGGVCSMAIGTTYTFSYWIKSVSTTVTNAATQATIGCQILNATSVTLVSGNVLAPLPANGWQKVVYSFVPTGACVNIKLFNNNTSGTGNDFALDDMAVVAPPLPLSVSSSFSNPTCSNAASGAIVVYAANGTPPYITYTLSGAATQSNTTGVFNGLGAGTYTVSVTDTAGTTVSQSNITLVAPASGLTASSDTAICLGSPTTLSVSGGTTYTWTANPADASLTTPNSATVIVAPTQTTTYTVTSPVTSSVDLIANGNFNNGNVGFNSAYTYYNPANTAFVQKAYGVVVNPNTWEPGFSASCVDHTTGTGKMMVVDGSTAGATDLVWGQNIPVTAGQTYNFSFWIQTLSAGTPASIRVVINGVQIGTMNATGSTCVWTNFSQTWNSGVSTLAQIQLFDTVTSAPGNDFALDDITFTTTVNCNVTEDVVVTVNPIETPAITCGLSTSNSVTFDWPALANATSYTISYTINSGASISGGSITNNTFNVTGLNANDSVKITVVPVGTGCFQSGVAVCVAVACVGPNVTGTTFNQADCSVKLIGNSTDLGVTLTWNGPGLAANSPNPATTYVSGIYTVTAFNPTTGCTNTTTVTATISNGVPTPTYTVTQPTCSVLTGSIVFTGPVNPAPLPAPTELFISEVTDEDVGSLTYVEIYNGTGASKNLANYRLKVYNNGAASANCDLLLSGTLANNSVVVVAVGSAVNQGGVTPNLVFSTCGGVNTDDNIRLTTSANVPIDLWGRTDGVAFTPVNAPGYSYRRLVSAPHPSMTWNPADWNALDPQDYTNVGGYQYQVASYQYSIDGGVTFQSSMSFTNLPTGTYSLQVKDIVSGCVSAPIAVTLTAAAVPNPPTVTAITYCQNAPTVALTAIPSPLGTLNWYGTDATGGTASSTAPTPTSGALGTTLYYVSQTIAGCESQRIAITVNVVNTPPTITPLLLCDGAASTATTVAFDFNNVGQSSFSYSYTIDGGAPVTGSLVAPSNYVVTGVTQGQAVTFTLTWNGVCTPSQTITCYPTCVTPVTPAFAGVPSICSGTTLTALPTTSTNGVVGTWAPALNNTATTTYTFTPAAGECATTTTLTITVDPLVTPTFTAVPAICSGGTLTALPTTSNNGIQGTWTPALDNTATTTYTFTPINSACATTTTTTITVNPNVTPTFTAVPAICTGATLAALPTTSNNAITGTWAPALNNTATTTYSFTPTAGLCATTTTMTITVNPNTITPTFTAVPAICSGGTLAALPTTSNNGITGTWSPALNTTTTTTYTFTPAVGQCATTTTLTITVNPNVTPTFTAVPAVCEGTALAALPTTSNNGITGTWSPALNNTNTTTYTFTPTAGLCATTQTLVITILPKVTPTFTAVGPVCEGNAIPALPLTSTNSIAGTWSPALNNTLTTTYTFTPNAGVCAVATTMQIEVVPAVTPTVSVVTSCNSNSVTVTAPLGVNYQYSLDGGTYQSSPFFLNVLAGNHSLVAKQTVANCISTAVNFTVTSVVNDIVVTAPAPLQICDPNNDGFVSIDLTQAIPSITGGAPYHVTFHETQTDAQVDGTFIPTPSNYFTIDPWNQIIYVRVESTTTDCFAVLPLQVIANPTPEATTPTDFHLCDYTGATGQEPFDLTTKITEILGSINPVGTQVTFYTDNTAAQNGTNVGQITNVTGYLNTSSPQIIYVRVEFTATGCYDIVPLTLVVDGLPLATQPNYPQYSLCDYTGAVGHETFDLNSQVSSILLNQTGMDVLFYPSLAAAQAGLPNTSINALYPSLQYVNVPAYVQTLGIRITNHITGCYSISTMDIRVNPLPSPIPPTSAYTLCDENQDGITEFDLTTLTADILQGAPYSITYYETSDDADQNTNPILDPAHYVNLFAFNQILYVRAEDLITHCYTVMLFTIAVDPSPIAPVNVLDIELCDQDSNPYNASTVINLTQNTLGILGQQPLGASSYTIEYYTSLALAQAGTAPIIPASAFVGADGQTIWVRVENNLTGCYNIGTFDLIIHIPLLLTTPPVLNMCDDDLIPNNQHTEFDLTVRDLDINLGTGYTVTYYTSSNVLITDPAHYVNGLPGAVEPITAVVTTPFGCISSTILDIRVLPVPTPLDPSIATPELTLGVQCENATGSGVAQFDLTTNAGYIMNGDPSVTLHYFPTQADLDNNTNEILNPATAIVGDPAIAGTTVGLVQYVYIAVSSSVFSDYTGRKCYKEVKEGFVVNPLPTVAAIADFQICENDPVSNNGIEVFDLTTQNAALLAGNATTPVSAYTVAYYEGPGLTNLITNPTTYSNTSNPQTIVVQITNTTTGCKSDVGNFNLVVNPKPIIATLMPDMSSCDTDGVNDGQMLFTQSGTSPLTSLAGYTEWVLGTTQTAPTYVVEFYDNQTSAEAGISTNALTDLENYQVHTGTYWVRVENLVTGCYQLDSFDVIIEKLARPVITSNTGSNIACVTWGTTTVVNNLILDSGITAPNYTFNWYADGQLVAGENNSTINITNVATSATHVVYTVEAVSVNPPMLGCTSVITPASTFDVIKSGQAANLNYTVTNAFAENQVITVTNDGYGVYQYSMDDGPRQMSPIFENVSIGTHTIYVWDTLSPDGYSCGVQLIENVETIDYPHYFTPNYDGIHDSWNIHGLVNQPYAKIYVFDRFGKLLKQLSPTTEGWDGTYNGRLMPSDDYWFTVDYQEGTATKQFKAHFAMKR